MNDLNRAAIIHGLITNDFKVTAGQSYTNIYSNVLSRIQAVLKTNDLSKGLAFPVGISVNEIAAHDSASSTTDLREIPPGAVVKIDIGVHFNGYIIDCARTFDLSCSHLALVNSTKAATALAIKMFRPGTHIIDISEKIEETINSFEELDGTKIKPMAGIGGHSIAQWTIHSGQLIPCVPNYSDCKSKIRSDTQYAVETFASTGSGKTVDIPNTPISHFMVNRNGKDPLLKKLWEMKKTLPFSPYDCPFVHDDRMRFKRLQNEGSISKFCALGDRPDKYTSQHEETIFVTEEKTKILTEGSFL